MDLSLLKSKFRGTMLGALIGDCTGSPYDSGDQLTSGMKLVLQKSFDKLEGPPFKGIYLNKSSFYKIIKNIEIIVFFYRTFFLIL